MRNSWICGFASPPAERGMVTYSPLLILRIQPFLLSLSKNWLVGSSPLCPRTFRASSMEKKRFFPIWVMKAASALPREDRVIFCMLLLISTAYFRHTIYNIFHCQRNSGLSPMRMRTAHHFLQALQRDVGVGAGDAGVAQDCLNVAEVDADLPPGGCLWGDAEALETDGQRAATIRSVGSTRNPRKEPSAARTNRLRGVNRTLLG